MANSVRGEVPFRASGRDLFLFYGTREIAEVQTALGFHRPDPFLADVVEEISVPVQENGRLKLDAAGVQQFRLQNVIVDAAERQRRMIAAFDAVLMNPDPESLITFFRVALRPWQRRAGVKLSEEGFQDIVAALGLVRLKALHFQALTLGAYLEGEGGDDDQAVEGKAPAASASSI